MSKVAVIFGYGPGISDAVLSRFASSKGYKVAVTARNAERLQSACDKWAAQGVVVKAYPVDLSKPEQVPALLGQVAADLGPIDVVIYNAATSAAYDATPEQIVAATNVNIVSMHQAYNTLLPLYKARGSGAFLLTGGGFAYNGAWSVGLGFQMGAAAKAYYINFAQSASATHKDAGVNVVCMTVMGMVASDLVKAEVAGDDVAFRNKVGEAYFQAANADKAAWVHEVQIKKD